MHACVRLYDNLIEKRVLSVAANTQELIAICRVHQRRNETAEFHGRIVTRRRTIIRRRRRVLSYHRHPSTTVVFDDVTVLLQ